METARKRIPEEEAVRFFRERDHFVIYTHNTPDADTIGSAAALVRGLRKIGKHAYAWNAEGVPERLAFLCGNDIFLQTLDPLPPGFDSPVPVSVDIASPKMLSEPDRQVFALAIDHHATNTAECELLYLKETYPAVGQIVFELLRGLGVDPAKDKEIAGALYAAISADSGGFRYDATSPDTMRVAAELMEAGIDFAQINRYLFDQKPLSRIALEGIAIRKLKVLCGGKFAYVCLTEEDYKEAGATEEDSDGLHDIPRQAAGVEISAVIKPKAGGWKCSFRSNGKADVAALAGKLGGGGHIRASSFSRTGITEKEMCALVTDAVTEALEDL